MTGRPIDRERRQERQDRFLAAFAETGIIKQAAGQSGVVAAQHHKWLATDPGYSARFRRLKDDTVPGPRTPHSRGYRQGGQRGETRRRMQDEFLAALGRLGVVADAAAEARIAKATYHLWMRTDPEFAGRAQEVIAASRDRRLSTLFERRSRAGREAWSDTERRSEWARRQREEFWTPERRSQWGQRVSESARTPEARAARSAAAKRQWKNPEAHTRHSEAMRQRWADPAYQAHMVEYAARPEVREARSRAARERWAAMSPEQRKTRLKTMRATFKGGYRLTKLEAAVMVALNERDLPYLVHKPIDGYVADILVPSLNLVIECDGTYHHDRRDGTDEVRDSDLLALGYHTLRLSEPEITGKAWDRLDEAVARLS